ncbi:MAG: gliding motility protein GldN [Bacteroidales bacterium]|nr:gliding motility protein GldN [Bacteroidaceae bacterium]MBR6975132.1 gliding motility protein GldN [Bacteroidaceae bacterium]MDO4201711.1 gliding motility protein GldN [Bacteroidales bacterium]
MKRINLIALLVAVNCQLSIVNCYAQPQKSRVQNNNRPTAVRNNANSTAVGTDRASLMFPTAVDVPEDPSWRRDIYRSIDLTKDENAALYYPVEPQGGQMNLFTLLFKLLNTGKIPAYDYQLDGLENFQQSNRMHFKDMLDRQGIFYEVDGNSIKVNQADIPSADVLSYYVKESSYYDQNTATYHSRIVALCPVLHRAADEFAVRSYVSEDGEENEQNQNVQKFPLFWVKYDDVKNYLSGQDVMTSNINNAARMSMDDFFSTNHYKGDIYMTTNMQNKSLQQYCATDSLLKKEQTRIEKQMTDFEEHIWSTPVDSVEQARRDSIAALNLKGKKARKAAEASSSAARSSRRAASSSKKEKSGGSSSGGGNGAPRVSVRRQRH